ncbi:unnamed protein product [Phaedon cochleariae]|uniref:Cytochrome c oxidase subunit VIa n=1 Tax=Phaedon cochleariae TaxID=80249 RepID=A0A9P0GK99_PHACE|nr:unnamed protein product [Phaedon cochleariae]
MTNQIVDNSELSLSKNYTSRQNSSEHTVMNNLIRILTQRAIHSTPTHSSHEPKCPPFRGGIPPPSHVGGYKIYKTLFFVVGLPLIALAMANCALRKQQRAECEERPPFVKYEYLRKRDKRYPWGDGVRSFFHNPKVNALPDGYEDE